jgi:hypothetical protein
MLKRKIRIHDFIKTITLFLIFFTRSQSYSQVVQYNQEFQVNTYTYNAQMRPDIAPLSEDKFVVCWQSKDQDGSSWGIYAQIFDHNAQKLGEEFRVNTTVESIQENPRVCGVSDGGFVICWDSYGDIDGSATAVFAQRFDKNGVMYGEEFQVNTYTENYQYGPDISDLTNGNFVVCWNSLEQDGSGDGIFGQLFKSDGTKKGEEFQINTYTSNRQKYPSVCGLSGGGFVVCWQSYGQDEQWDGIFMQIYDSSGVKYGEETQVNTEGSRWQGNPSVDMIDNDRFVICWDSEAFYVDSKSDIIAQIFNNYGEKLGNEIVVNTDLLDYQYFPSISRLGEDGFVICWESNEQDGNLTGVFAQMYDHNEEKNGWDFGVNNLTETPQQRPRVCGFSNGDFVVCWETVGQDGSSQSIAGKYYLGETISHSLEQFSLISPAMDATLYSTAVDFQWQTPGNTHINFPWELEYTLYLYHGEDFIDPQIFSDIFDTTFTAEPLKPGQTYFWKILVKNIEGDSLWSSETFGFYINPAAAIEDDRTQKPDDFKLYPNYPNPFNPKTIITYEIPITNYVEVNIYNLLGQPVVNLISKKQNAGYHQVEWDASDFAGGVYYYRIEAGNFVQTRKMIYLK